MYRNIERKIDRCGYTYAYACTYGGGGGGDGAAGTGAPEINR